MMPGIVDIPKIYTAIAEWMACIAVIVIYRKYIEKSLRSIVFTVTSLAAAFGLIYVIQYFCQDHDGIVWLLAMGVAVLVMMAEIAITLGFKFSTAAYITARAFIWGELAASLEWQVYYYYTFALDKIPPAWFGFVVAIPSYTLLYVIFYIAESRELPKDSSKPTVTYVNVVFAWVITFLLFGLSNLSYLLRNTPFSGTDTTDIFNIRTLSDLIGVVMGQMFHLQKRDMERREENAAFQTILRNQYIQFRESKNNIEMINRKYHDLKHQLQILRNTENPAERTAYIDEIQQGIEKYEAENKTGNSVLDTVLTSKQSRCLAKNVTMTVVADGTLINRLSVMDICTVFGNALDNAIEYEAKVEDPEKRLVHVTVSEKNNFVCILVENYYEGETIQDGAFPETTKKNKQFHGFGLKSVKYTIEKYGGYINTGVRDGWFKLEMILPKE